MEQRDPPLQDIEDIAKKIPKSQESLSFSPNSTQATSNPSTPSKTDHNSSQITPLRKMNYDFFLHLKNLQNMVNLLIQNPPSII